MLSKANQVVLFKHNFAISNFIDSSFAVVAMLSEFIDIYQLTASITIAL